MFNIELPMGWLVLYSFNLLSEIIHQLSHSNVDIYSAERVKSQLQTTITYMLNNNSIYKVQIMGMNGSEIIAQTNMFLTHFGREYDPP